MLRCRAVVLMMFMMTPICVARARSKKRTCNYLIDAAAAPTTLLEGAAAEVTNRLVQAEKGCVAELVQNQKSGAASSNAEIFSAMLWFCNSGIRVPAEALAALARPLLMSSSGRPSSADSGTLRFYRSLLTGHEQGQVQGIEWEQVDTIVPPHHVKRHCTGVASYNLDDAAPAIL